MPTDRARLPLLLLSVLSERPMHGYEVNRELDERSVRAWAAVGFSSVYQTLDRLAADGLLDRHVEAGDRAGVPSRTVYSLNEVGRARLHDLARRSLASAEHQRFDYDLGLGVALMHLPPDEVRAALERRRDAVVLRARSAAEACEWADRYLAAWAVLEHQRRALDTEVTWLNDVIVRLRQPDHPVPEIDLSPEKG